MKAVVKQAATHGAVAVEDIAAPEAPGAGEVLVRIHSAALCGSDVHAYEFIPSYRNFMHIPVVLGHEGCGVVEAVGPGVTRWTVGDRVMAESNIYCGRCPNCRTGQTHICEANLMRGLTTPGVMRDYVLFAEHQLHAVPDNLSFDEGAAAQAVTVSVHGVLGRIRIRPGDTAVVTGIGIIGLAAAQLARTQGARVMLFGTDADEHSRLPLAREMGFHAVNIQQTPAGEAVAAFCGSKADWLLECSGAAAALTSGLDIIRKGGSILMLGLPDKDVLFPFAKAVRGEINLISSYTSNWDDYEMTLRLLAMGSLTIRPLLTPYPVEEAVRAFEDAVSKHAVKPVLRFVESLD